MDKLYVGAVYDSLGGNQLTLEWILNSFLQDLLNWGEGWLQRKPVHPGTEPNAMGFVATKAYNGSGQNPEVILSFLAGDLGNKRLEDGTLVRHTGLQVQFTDSSGEWENIASEQIVAEAMQLFSKGAVVEVSGDRQFWYHAQGEWVCGRDLFSCPRWRGPL
jgi:hypothetical protein